MTGDIDELLRRLAKVSEDMAKAMDHVSIEIESDFTPLEDLLARYSGEQYEFYATAEEYDY